MTQKDGKKRDLPENTSVRAIATMILMPAAETIRKERVNSPTRLLAATLAFKIIQKFADGTTQCSMHEKYSIECKELALNLSGCK